MFSERLVIVAQINNSGWEHGQILQYLFTDFEKSKIKFLVLRLDGRHEVLALYQDSVSNQCDQVGHSSGDGSLTHDRASLHDAHTSLAEPTVNDDDAGSRLSRGIFAKHSHC